MNRVFQQYPPYLRFLIPIFILQQTAYYLFEYQLEFNYSLNFEQEDSSFGVQAIYSHKTIIIGVLSLIAGYLCERFQKTKRVLLYSISVMLLGHTLIMLNLPILSGIGAVSTILASSVFFIKIVLNIAILFPIANAPKENSYNMVFMGASLILLIISFIINSFFEIGLFIGAILIYLSLLYFINLNQDLGYYIEDDDEIKDQQDIKKEKWILLGGIVILTFCNISYTYISVIGPFEGSLEGGLSGLINSFSYTVVLTLGPFFSLIIALGYLIYAFFYLGDRLNALEKIMLGLIMLCLLFGLDLFNFVLGSYILEYFLPSFSLFVGSILILPPVLSILTHINFSKNAAIWLGIVLGIPNILSYLVDQASFFLLPQYIAWACLIGLIALFIFLRENNGFILKQLALHEPNQDIEDTFEEDPFDHLIE